MSETTTIWASLGTLVGLGILFFLKWAFIGFCITTIIKWIVKLVRNTWNEGGGDSMSPPVPVQASCTAGSAAFCIKCGTRLSEGAAFCHKCGEKIISSEGLHIKSFWIWCVALTPMAGWLLQDIIENADSVWIMLDCALPMALFMALDRRKLLVFGIDIPMRIVWISAFLFWPLYPFKRYKLVYDVTRTGLASLIMFNISFTLYTICLLLNLAELL